MLGEKFHSGDHPRIRGEHPAEPRDDADRLGSSPHTRGARKASLAGWVSSRIIPAYAGSTYCWEDPTDTDRDHPRIRGEHPFMVALLGIAWGSSPHTRGARVSPPSAPGSLGIIPAYAGSTRRHPIRHTRRQGSSPHTRGAHRPMRTERTGAGIIPAYAGSTADALSRSGRRADHPRIRGEHQRVRLVGDHALGSSPHTRGARWP